MGIIPYVRTNATQRDIQEVENGLVRTFQSIINNPLLGTIAIVPNIIVRMGADTIVNQQIGRPVTGWIVINKTQPGDLYQSPTTNTLPAVNYIFRATADNIYTILFF